MGPSPLVSTGSAPRCGGIGLTSVDWQTAASTRDILLCIPRSRGWKCYYLVIAQQELSAWTLSCSTFSSNASHALALPLPNFRAVIARSSIDRLDPCQVQSSLSTPVQFDPACSSQGRALNPLCPILGLTLNGLPTRFAGLCAGSSFRSIVATFCMQHS